MAQILPLGYSENSQQRFEIGEVDDMAADGVRSGVLLLSDGEGWTVVEVDAILAASLNPVDAAMYESRGHALHAAYDLLTLESEGRVPAMHEHVQESLHDFLRALEDRGYDRESAVKILLELADRRASDPPKAPQRRRVSHA